MRACATTRMDECCSATGRMQLTAGRAHGDPTFTSSLPVRAFGIVFQKIPGFVADFREWEFRARSREHRDSQQQIKNLVEFVGEIDHEEDNWQFWMDRAAGRMHLSPGYRRVSH